MAKHLPEDIRFNRYVSRGDGCWAWTGVMGTNGYGLFWVRRGFKQYSSVGAHRVAWRLANGPVPDGLWVLHRCDNPRCVRPDHLFLGTHSDNMRDMWSKNRHRPRGTAPTRTHCAHGHKFTPENTGVQQG